MSKLNFDYVPLTFISDKQEIKKQIRNTLILIHLFEKYNNPVRLEKLIVGTQYGYNASALQSGNNKFLRISDIHDSKVNWDSVPYCNCDDEETYLLKNEDILIARTGGTTGKSFKIDSPPKHSIYAGYLIRIRAKKEVNPDYIYLFLHSFAYWSQIVNLNERNFRPKANAENLKSLILPDCERNIQDEAVRISQGENIKGYEDLFLEIEKALSEYDKTQQVENLLSDQLTELENLNQAILQEAVQGKLVKQDKKDEPASELLKRIKEEKAKSGKKEKPLPPIKPEENPFEIPENWVWCRLGEICESVNDGVHYAPTYLKSGIPSLSAKDIFNNKINLEKCNYVSMEEYNSQKQKFQLREGSLLVTKSGSIGRTVVFDGKQDLYLVESVGVINTNLNYIEPSYIKYFIDGIFDTITYKGEYVKGMGVKHLTLTLIKSMKLPLPSLSEQKRIVSEIEKQLAKTKQLKEHIIANQQATEQLLKALLHQAFELEEMEEV
ncbi:MAG: restriction endonuclease subunit S [Bacteroidia bacterium]|nr:restriction endonuclease subunit S [Bacteroidia bacterium]